MRLQAHYWTLRPYLRRTVLRIRTPQPEVIRPWSTVIEDDRHGPVRVRGELHEVPDSHGLVLLVHGLGGGPDSPYCREAVHEFGALGYSTLNLAMRGACHSGEDIYHGGLWSDLAAVIGDIEGYERIFVCGFSVGGHVTLRLAVECRDPRLAGVAAICSPVNLAVARTHIDEHTAAIYRKNVISGLKASYARLRPERMPTEDKHVRTARTIYEWDQHTVVPRFGFDSPEDYYAAEAVAPRLGDLAAPALLIVAEHDPIVPSRVVVPYLSRDPALDVRWAERGGHLGFPPDLDLRLGRGLGLVPQVAHWFEAQGRP